MTGSVALDVVIGLVFIYSLYSLLTTTVTEMVATLIRLRSSFLESGIKRMLDDGSKTTVLSEGFFNQPLIKYLGSGSLGGLIKKPSYLSAQNFSKALLELLKVEGGKLLKETPSPTTLAKIQESLKKLTSTSETITFIHSLLEDAQNDLDKFKTSLEQWYDDTMERVTSWYKKWIQLIMFFIGFLIAAIFNVDTISIVKKLSHDPKAREQYISFAQKLVDDKEFAKQVAGDTAQQKNFDELKNTFTSLRVQALESNDVLSVKRGPFGRDQFFGWLITAVALSFGAPFWFDLLNKLMKLRSSVPTASQSSPGPKSKETDSVKRVG